MVVRFVFPRRSLDPSNRADWIHADVVEITKLVFDTGTLEPTHHPAQNPTRYNRVVREKIERQRC
jgi:hypothetical protein